MEPSIVAVQTQIIHNEDSTTLILQESPGSIRFVHIIVRDDDLERWYEERQKRKSPTKKNILALPPGARM